MTTRDTLFDLAIERALTYAQSLNISFQDKKLLEDKLELWYLKTRFAYRVPLEDIINVLSSYPGQGKWTNGKNGAWQKHIN
ncbi:MAG: hypothetical protein ACRCYY_08995 [Trueperaceae bacterium]